VQKLWQHQPVEGINMSVEEIRRRAGKFERRIWRRNAREYVASLIAVALFVYFLASAHDWLSRVTFALFIGAMLWIVVALHRNGSAKKLPKGVDTLTGLRFYRTELQRQYGVVKSVWWWYLAPMVPGFVVYTIGHAVKSPHPAAWAGLAVMDMIVAGLFYVVWRMNMKAARCLERMINELNAAE
jgi:Flp pilus assembly protein TadB